MYQTHVARITHNAHRTRKTRKAHGVFGPNSFPLLDLYGTMTPEWIIEFTVKDPTGKKISKQEGLSALAN
jgi:hypothetical protein